MECHLWKMVVAEMTKVKAAFSARWSFSVGDIVLTYFWAVLHDRPVSWACQRSSWPVGAWRRRRPTPSTMSRRLRTPAVREAIGTIERTVLPQPNSTLLHAIDGKPLPVSRHSQDRDARFGRGAGGLDKGYKLHVIYEKNGSIAAWEVTPLNVDERVVARRLVAQTELTGYLVADAYYDDSALYDAAQAQGAQLIAPRRKGAGRGLGHRRQSPAHLRGIQMLEQSPSGFGAALLRERRRIEGYFGTLVTAHYGLDRLPAWVRGLPRVRAWVQAKLILDRLAYRRRRAG